MLRIGFSDSFPQDFFKIILDRFFREPFPWSEANVDELQETLLWLEEFLWNQDPAFDLTRSFGRSCHSHNVGGWTKK